MDSPQPMSMPFPFMVPWPQGQHNHPDPAALLRPPVRVTIALEFLQQLALKTMNRAAVSHGAQLSTGGEVVMLVPGQSLSNPEQATQAAACSLLARYFEGELAPDPWEAAHLSLLQEANLGEECHVIPCPACNRMTGNGCQICEGRGKVITTPMNKVNLRKKGEDV